MRSGVWSKGGLRRTDEERLEVVVPYLAADVEDDADAVAVVHRAAVVIAELHLRPAPKQKSEDCTHTEARIGTQAHTSTRASRESGCESAMFDPK